VSVFRSARHIYGQIIDDATGNTLASCSTLEVKNIEGDKKTIAHQIGLELARRAQEKGISKVAFDRGSFLYHGRVKALAEGLREGGLEI
jgi:large subunit ribosomal protein L18